MICDSIDAIFKVQLLCKQNEQEFWRFDNIYVIVAACFVLTRVLCVYNLKKGGRDDIEWIHWYALEWPAEGPGGTSLGMEEKRREKLVYDEGGMINVQAHAGFKNDYFEEQDTPKISDSLSVVHVIPLINELINGYCCKAGVGLSRLFMSCVIWDCLQCYEGDSVICYLMPSKLRSR